MDRQIVLVGCGNMGQALLRGWLARGVSPRGIRVIDPQPAARAAARALAVEAAPRWTAPEVGGAPEVVVVAVKPAQLGETLPQYRCLAAGEVVFLSIVAGKRIGAYTDRLGPAVPVVRAMPNTPAAIGRGMTVLCAGAGVGGAQRSLCGELMSAVGEIAWVEQESQMDAVTALSGSGPAYVFLLIECLAEAGVRTGLDGSLARRLAQVTVAGAGAYAEAAEEDAAELRRRVTSPGGTTEAALAVLMAEDGGLQELIGRAVRAATERSRELG